MHKNALLLFKNCKNRPALGAMVFGGLGIQTLGINNAVVAAKTVAL